MNINVLGGTLGVAALAGILFFGAWERKPAPKPAPAPIVVSKPAPKAAPKPAPKVAPKPKAAPKKVVPAKPTESPDNSFTCRAARAFIAGKTQAELEAYRKQYKISKAQIAKYEKCFE